MIHVRSNFPATAEERLHVGVEKHLPRQTVGTGGAHPNNAHHKNMKIEQLNETRWKYDFPSHYRKVIAELEAENAELRSRLNDPAAVLIAGGHHLKPEQVAALLGERFVQDMNHLREQNQLLRRDRERMDWLSEEAFSIHMLLESGGVEVSCRDGRYDGETLREAVDEARREGGVS